MISDDTLLAIYNQAANMKPERTEQDCNLMHSIAYFSIFRCKISISHPHTSEEKSHIYLGLDSQ